MQCQHQRGVTSLPDDVLWLVLREVIYYNTASNKKYRLHEYHKGFGGYNKSGLLARRVLELAQTTRTFRRCIRRKCIWHTTNHINGWDFVPGAFPKDYLFVNKKVS